MLGSRMFLEDAGLPRRRWYKNVLMASGFDKGYGAETFPGVTQAIADKNAGQVVEQTAVVVSALTLKKVKETKLFARVHGFTIITPTSELIRCCPSRQRRHTQFSMGVWPTY